MLTETEYRNMEYNLQTLVGDNDLTLDRAFCATRQVLSFILHHSIGDTPDAVIDKGVLLKALHIVERHHAQATAYAD